MEHAMKTLPRTSNFLRFVLMLDAAVSGATGLLMAFLAAPLAKLLNVPEDLLFYAGLVLFPYAAFVAWLARREVVLRSAVWAAIVLNVLWAADCLLLAFGGWLEPNALGYGFIVMQAVVVAAFAELQYVGLRRSVTA
jgi:hypothetical protein